jgi:ubiquinone/menaquinone biosynthesis C-methylase UbiE
MTFLKYLSNQLNSITKVYKKSSIWGKILIFSLLIVLLVVIFKGKNNNDENLKEGFEQSEQFIVKSGEDIYDDFYADIYDYLVYNKIKNKYEVGEIINSTGPTEESIILDVGCGTGDHVNELSLKGLDVIGLDISQAMIQKATNKFPKNKFKLGNAMNIDLFKPSSFTHILCMYFTIYYFQDKLAFFNNCFEWLMPGGYLIIHLVNRDEFDPILPPGNPLMLVSPQKYAKQRITTTKVKFTDFSYKADFQFDKSKGLAKFVEKFKQDNSGKVRKNEHTLYMENQEGILVKGQEAGFILQGQIDLTKAQYEYQYLYILTKPN